MKQLEKAHEIARARLYLKQGKSLKYYKDEFPESTMAVSSLYNYFADNPSAKPSDSDSLEKLQNEVDRLNTALLSGSSLTDLEVIKQNLHNPLKIMSALGITEKEAKEKIEAYTYEAKEEELDEAREVYERLRMLITDEELEIYPAKYRDVALEALMSLLYINELFPARVYSTKDHISYLKSRAFSFKLLARAVKRNDKFDENDGYKFFIDDKRVDGSTHFSFLTKGGDPQRARAIYPKGDTDVFTRTIR